jgi:phage terminase large subunit-like protein
MRNPEGNAAKRVAIATPGPWRSWRIRTRHGRAIRFMETYCRAPKGKGHGQPMKLAGFQKEFLEEALADGIDAAVLSTPRGNGKSSLGGALATWALFDDDATGSPQVPIIATTITQAVRSCYGVAAAMVRAEPELLRRSLIFTGFAQPRIVAPFNGGEMFPMSNQPEGIQGLDASLAIVDEIGFQPQDSWDSLRLASGKRERSLSVGLGTPGTDRDNALWFLRRLVREGGDLPGFVFREHAAPEGCALDDRQAWRKANPAIRAGFLRMSALETDLGITPEGHFRTFRLGQWVDGVDAWLGADGAALWEGLTNPYGFVEGAPTWVGVDIALKRDTSAVVAIQRRPDGRYHAVCRIWTPTPDRPVDVTDVMQHIRDLDAAYSVEAVSFDPRFFDVPAKMLLDEGLPMMELPQSVDRMTMAVGGLYEAIVHRQVTHDGDQSFAAQVLNAVARSNDRGFTLAKSKSRGKIDAAIALALALDRAQRHEDDSSVYADRGAIEL